MVCGGRSGLDMSADLGPLRQPPAHGAPDVRRLHTGPTVWAGRATGDWVGDVPHTRLELPFTTPRVRHRPGVAPPSSAPTLFAAGDGGPQRHI
ncbi:hypothetical protein GCM10020221_31200 [Streptomyces thioluteus]|uniref:Uncharacterized protein n=1 Tax=Streptomyces thioluteus TaxID=66431 RepID=A0ABN3X2Q5_STRTU